jgi:hypothetical protein
MDTIVNSVNFDIITLLIYRNFKNTNFIKRVETGGFEPPQLEPKSKVLPLDDVSIYYMYILKNCILVKIIHFVS